MPLAKNEEGGFYAKYVLADFLMFEFSVALLTMKAISFLQEMCVYEERVIAKVIADPQRTALANMPF